MVCPRVLRVVCLLLSLVAGQAAAGAPAKKKYELVTDHLPTVEELLQTLEMPELLDTFYNSGFTETFYVLRCEMHPRPPPSRRHVQTPPLPSHHRGVPTAAPNRRRRRRRHRRF